MPARRMMEGIAIRTGRTADLDELVMKARRVTGEGMLGPAPGKGRDRQRENTHYRQGPPAEKRGHRGPGRARSRRRSRRPPRTTTARSCPPGGGWPNSGRRTFRRCAPRRGATGMVEVKEKKDKPRRGRPAERDPRRGGRKASCTVAASRCCGAQKGGRPYSTTGTIRRPGCIQYRA